jgi:cobalt transporter subunit CbtB
MIFSVRFPARAALWPMAALGLLALLGLYAVGLDQGQILSVWLGETSYQLNLVHELVHDTRHAAGFPCH